MVEPCRHGRSMSLYGLAGRFVGIYCDVFPQWRAYPQHGLRLPGYCQRAANDGGHPNAHRLNDQADYRRSGHEPC